MSRQFTKNFGLEVARGNISGMSSVNKFGRNTSISTVAEDIHDGGGIWVAPTTARIHDIASSSASDASGGVGARTIKVYGLTSWSTAEVNETITMNGVTNVPTVNSYVIIHRMKVLTSGATSINVGTITATAQTDATVTAQINPSEGQTQMAIYGIPSTQTAYMTSYYASMPEASGFFGTSEDVKLSLLVNANPNAQLTNFLIKHTQGITASGTSYIPHKFNPCFGITGPAIIKIQAIGSANGIDCSAGFDLILVTNS